MRTLKKIREQKGLLQKEVATHLNLDKSAYSKLEKGTRELKINELLKLASLFRMGTNEILHFEGNIPKEVVIEDKVATEQLRLIAQLDEEDQQIIFKMIDKMLTTKKFKTFFQENINK